MMQSFLEGEKLSLNYRLLCYISDPRYILLKIFVAKVHIANFNIGIYRTYIRPSVGSVLSYICNSPHHKICRRKIEKLDTG